jgi:hypothetical protein
MVKLNKYMNITWILEREIFSDNHKRLSDALNEKGISVIDWKDQWVEDKSFPNLIDQKVVFHGCLGNASLITKQKIWNPGAYCNVANFKCTSWYDESKKWLFQKNWISTTVQKLIDNPDKYLEKIGSNDFFVRPNSPLKPFAGRVLTKDNISLQALDFGFYYDDPNEEIILSSLQTVKQEWRYVICNNQVITGSSYIADNRAADDKDWAGKPLELAQEIASTINAPDDVYIMDICDSDEGYKLLELNPFSGADLYNCDRSLIVDATTKLLTHNYIE